MDNFTFYSPTYFVFGKSTEAQTGELVKRYGGHKVLITTLTKKMAEDLTDYMKDVGIRVRYLHSDIDTLERA